MTTRRTCFCDPPVAIEYDAVFDADGETVTAIVPVRFFDLTTSPNGSADQANLVYTALNTDTRYPNALYDPAKVQAECQAVWARDRLYLAAMQAAAPFVAPDQIARFDQDGQVMLTIDPSVDLNVVAQVQQAMTASSAMVGDISLNDVSVGSPSAVSPQP